jgi:copper transport protein
MSAVSANPWPGRLLGLLVAAICLVLPAIGSAHASLVRSDPAAEQVVQASPKSVTLTFNEPVETALAAIRVFDDGARRVDVGTTVRAGRNVLTTRIDQTLARGTYTVSWRIASADGHPIEGAFVFHVGAPGARPEGIADQVARQPSAGVARATDVMRFLNLALVVALIGAIAVTLVLFGRLDGEVERRMWYVIAGLGFTLSIVTAATIVLHAAGIAAAGLGEAAQGSALSAVLGTRFGQVRLAQLVIAEVIAIAAVWAPSPGGRRGLKLTLAALAVGLAVTPGLSGHAGAKGSLEVVADSGHVLAASVWVGGLAALSVGLVLAGSRRRELAAAALPGFSTMALWSVAVLLVAGTIGALAHVDRIGDLWNTTYGKLLLTKIIIALVLIGFGAANRRSVRRMTDTAAGATSLVRLRRSIAVEFVLMAAAIAVTSVLIAKPPANALAAAPPPTLSVSGRVDDLDVRLVVAPGVVGQNRVDVYLTSGANPAKVDEVTVTARPAVGDVGPFRLTGQQTEVGHSATPGLQAAVGGLWTFTVAVRRGEFDLKDTTLSVPIRSVTTP